MRNHISLFIIICLFCNFNFGQTVTLKPVAKMVSEFKITNPEFNKSAPFQRINSPAFKTTTDLFANNITYAKMDMKKISGLYHTKNAALELTIPYKNNSLITLDLISVNIFADEFSVQTDVPNEEALHYQPGVYYQGIVRDDPNSIVAISIFENELMGLISTSSEGNINIGRYGKGESDDYMIFSDREILVQNNNAECATNEDDIDMGQFHDIMNIDGSSRITACPKIYFEADFQLFQNKGSVINTTNYITSIYNNSAVIYTNESVPTQVSGIFIWTSSDPFGSASSDEALDDFMTVRPTFTGDIAQLLTLDPGDLGGVAATVNGLCGPLRYCYSDIDPTFADFPTYSWTVMVVTHEMGHLFGSLHTQNCEWIGGPIDNCASPEGGCAPGPEPIGGGTIMSYCHLTGYGINLSNGFEDIWLQKVNLAGTIKNSGNNGGFADFTATTFNLVSGGTTSFTLFPGYLGPAYPVIFSIWIDYNKDLDFIDPGENVYNSAAVLTPVSGSFVVPAGLTGTTRMRISMKYETVAGPCESIEFGEVEDYTASFSGGGITYCSSAGTSSSTRYIDLVKIGTITRNSVSDGGYFNATALVTNVAKGSTYNLKYSAGFSGTIFQMYWRAWVDFNHDGDFTDAGEQIFQKTETTSSNLSKNFLIPLTATTGATRMRVSSKFGGYPTSCETFTNGEVEDFTLNILPGLPFAEETFSLDIYPNPSDGIYQLEYTNAINGGINIDVFDILGNKIIVNSIEQELGVINLDITNAAPGLYLMLLRSCVFV